jgi:hypothetical protein
MDEKNASLIFYARRFIPSRAAEYNYPAEYTRVAPSFRAS